MNYKNTRSTEIVFFFLTCFFRVTRRASFLEGCCLEVIVICFEILHSYGSPGKVSFEIMSGL